MDTGNSKRPRGIGEAIRARGFVVPLALVLVVIGVFAGISAFILWRYQQGHVSNTRAPVYGTILSALGDLMLDDE